MKKTIQVSKLLLLVFIIPAFLFSACKKDEILDLITFNGKKIPIAGGLIENFGIAQSDPASYNMGLTFYSDGITYHQENSDFTGEGTILYVSMYSSDPEDLEPGTYVFNPGSQNSMGFNWGVIVEDIVYDRAAIEFSQEKSFKIAGESIDDGTVKVTKSNSVYTITLSATTSTDKSLKASFKGPLPMVDKRVTR